jgi:hypothetical protein
MKGSVAPEQTTAGAVAVSPFSPAVAICAPTLQGEFCPKEVRAWITADAAARDEFSMRMSHPRGMVWYDGWVR